MKQALLEAHQVGVATPHVCWSERAGHYDVSCQVISLRERGRAEGMPTQTRHYRLTPVHNYSSAVGNVRNKTQRHRLVFDNAQINVRQCVMSAGNDGYFAQSTGGDESWRRPNRDTCRLAGHLYEATMARRDDVVEHAQTLSAMVRLGDSGNSRYPRHADGFASVPEQAPLRGDRCHTPVDICCFCGRHASRGNNVKIIPANWRPVSSPGYVPLLVTAAKPNRGAQQLAL